MKTILIALSLVASISSFANDSITEVNGDCSSHAVAALAQEGHLVSNPNLYSVVGNNESTTYFFNLYIGMDKKVAAVKTADNDCSTLKITYYDQK